MSLNDLLQKSINTEIIIAENMRHATHWMAEYDEGGILSGSDYRREFFLLVWRFNFRQSIPIIFHQSYSG